jgi:glycosyltransferase involved in cell wall biosynthesis
MRVGFLAMHYPPEIRGGATFTYRLKHALEGIGVDIKLISHSRVQEADVRITPPNIPGKGGYAQLKIIGAVSDVDFVHSFNTGGFFVFNKPVIEHIHHYDFDWLKWNRLRKYLYIEREKFCYKKAKAVTTLTKTSAEELKRNYGKRKVDIIPCGIDQIERIEPGDPLKIICTVGSVFEKRKGTEILLGAFELVRKRFPDAVLYITGSKFGSAPLNLNVTNVKFTGELTEKEMEECYCKCGIAVVPSLCEGFGIPVLEAMAHGKALVTTRVGIACDELVHEKDALIVEPGDKIGLAASMIRLIENENLRGKLVTQGLVTSKRYTWERAAKECIKVYEYILNGV